MRGLIGPPVRAVLAALTLVVAIVWPGAVDAAPKETGHLLAGAAAVDVSLPPGVPLGGYGGLPRRAWLPDVFDRHPYAFWFKPSAGVHDPFRVRSLVLEAGPVRLLWFAVELVGIDPTLLTELRARLARRGLGDMAVIAAASHTHSGPGAYGDSALFGFIAIDRRSAVVRDRILDGLERAAREAAERKGPASVAWGRTDVNDITDSRVQERLDPELGVLKVTRPDGQPVAIVWTYAIHGTALGRDNMLLSGDLMGEASARLEREMGVPALFVNGAVGDVSPRPRGWPGVKAAGGALAAGAARAWAQAGAGSRELEVAVARVTLPAPTLALRNCVGSWTPGGMTLGLSAALPSSSEIVAVSVGGTGWVTIPGELDTRLGASVKAAGQGRFDHVFVAGVSNDYLGYFLTPEHYRRPSYIACGSLYGERGGEIVRDAAVAALERLAGSTGNRPSRSRSSFRERARPRRRRADAAPKEVDRLPQLCAYGRKPTAGGEAPRGAALRRVC